MKKENIKKIFSIAVERFSGTEVGNTSVLIAYYLLLSLFPMVIAVGNILPFFNIDPTVVIDYMRVIVPQPVQPVLESIINSLLTSANGGLLSISLLGALWSSSRGVNHLQRGVNKAYGITKPISIIAKRWLSLLTIMLVILLLLVFALVFGFGQVLMDALAPHVPGVQAVLSTLFDLKWPATLAFLFLLLLIVYRITPDVKIRMKDAVPGAVLATVGLVLLVQAFTIYLRFFARSFSSYGTLGAFFLLMFWLNFSAMIVLVGAVLNASIGEYRYGKAEQDISHMDTAIERTKNTLLEKLRQFYRKRKKTQEENGTEDTGGPPEGGAE